jgi:hypothetical protein
MFYSVYKLIYLVYQAFFIYKLLICTTLVPSNDVIRTREPVQHVTDGSNVSGKKFIQDIDKLSAPVNHHCKSGSE